MILKRFLGFDLFYHTLTYAIADLRGPLSYLSQPQAIKQPQGAQYLSSRLALLLIEWVTIIQLTSELDAIAPEILPYEIGNALSAMIKRKQITHDEAISAQKTASLIPVRLISIDIQQALKIAIKYNIYSGFSELASQRPSTA